MNQTQEHRLRVAEVMTVVTINASASLWEAIERFFLSGLRHLVVVTEDRCVGVLADRHVAAQWPLDLRGRPVAELLDGRQPYTVADAPVLDAARAMLAAQVDALPVVDERHHIVGVITGSDLTRVLVAIAGEEPKNHEHAGMRP